MNHEQRDSPYGGLQKFFLVNEDLNMLKYIRLALGRYITLVS